MKTSHLNFPCSLIPWTVVCSLYKKRIRETNRWSLEPCDPRWRAAVSAIWNQDVVTRFWQRSDNSVSTTTSSCLVHRPVDRTRHDPRMNHFSVARWFSWKGFTHELLQIDCPFPRLTHVHIVRRYRFTDVKTFVEEISFPGTIVNKKFGLTI